MGPPRDRNDIGWGILLVAAAVAGRGMDIRWPWLAVATAKSGFRDVLLGELLGSGPTPYESFLLVAPLVVWGVLFASGFILIGLGLAPRRFMLRRIRVVPWLFVAPAGFVLLLTGMRWVGLYVARLWDTGPTPLHLQWVPYLHAAGGAAMLALAIWRLVKQRGRPRRVGSRSLDPPKSFTTSLFLVALFAGTLLALPLLPFATTEAGGAKFHYDEATLAIFGAVAIGNATLAPQDLAWFRLATTGGIVVSLASFMAVVLGMSAAAPAWLRRRHRYTPLSVLPIVAVQGALAIRLPLDLVRFAPNTTLGLNVIPQIASLLGVAVLVWHMLRSRIEMERQRNSLA